MTLLPLLLLGSTAMASDELWPNPELGELKATPGKTTFYFDVEEGGTDIRVFHDGQTLEVERLGPCALPGDGGKHECFRAVSDREGLLTLRVDMRREGKWEPGEEVLVGLENRGIVVAHLPQWMVFLYDSTGPAWAVGLGGEWTMCRAGDPLPTTLSCRGGHWAFPSNNLVQVQVAHPDGPIRRAVIPVAKGVYTFYRSRRTIWGTLEPLP